MVAVPAVRCRCHIVQHGCIYGQEEDAALFKQ